ncbi:MAG TPA: 50S ribosomal protein L30e [Candidatus Diapherotrites archaeon]|uniref:50S ribosomal protein L30e n=2 Tax=Candidatus Iainarchaeum sp. TaxID=3101447 RepID=A0A7J4KW69_9ARCH|nr:50S ribosomal protein L30e [Candidatus Diapherotrites archaeon]
MADIGEISREIRRAVDTGTVFFGSKQAEKSLLSGSTELIIFSNNAPKTTKERIQEYAILAKVQCFKFEGNGLELGAACGKPFVVSVLSIKDAGKSKVATAFQELEPTVKKKEARKKAGAGKKKR